MGLIACPLRRPYRLPLFLVRIVLTLTSVIFLQFACLGDFSMLSTMEFITITCFGSSWESKGPTLPNATGTPRNKALLRDY